MQKYLRITRPTRVPTPEQTKGEYCFYYVFIRIFVHDKRSKRKGSYFITACNYE